MPDSMAPRSALQKHVVDFDIDNYLNPICPRQRFYLLPSFVSFWFGYRAPGSRPQRRLSNIGVWLSAAIGGFAGIAIITNVYAHLPMLGGHQVPLVIASFGAAAILEYNAIESPLSQPRNLIVGHVLAALIGVAVTKGFERLPNARFEELRWLAGSLAVGLSSLVMGMTKTVHPPAGATALLAATSTDVTVLGWWLLPLVLLAATLMCASAQLVNNLTRRWPLYWWTPADLSKKQKEIVQHKDIENAGDSSESESGRAASISDSIAKWQREHVVGGGGGSEVDSESTAATDRNVREDEKEGAKHIDTQRDTILITADKIVLPDGWAADDWEKEVLEIFKTKLQTRQVVR